MPSAMSCSSATLHDGRKCERQLVEGISYDNKSLDSITPFQLTCAAFLATTKKQKSAVSERKKKTGRWETGNSGRIVLHGTALATRLTTKPIRPVCFHAKKKPAATLNCMERQKGGGKKIVGPSCINLYSVGMKYQTRARNAPIRRAPQTKLYTQEKPTNSGFPFFAFFFVYFPLFASAFFVFVWCCPHLRLYPNASSC